jgi:hypothetical protein
MLDETAFTQSFMEGIKFLQSIFGRPSTHKPDDRHRRLLCGAPLAATPPPLRQAA